VQDHAPGVEGHRQALARTLGVPDHADAPVAGIAARPLAGLVPARRLRGPVRGQRLCGAQGLFHGRVHRVKLVVAGHLLHELAASAAGGRRVLEHDEVAQQVEKAPLLENPLQHHLQLRLLRGRILAPGDGAPGFEPLLARAERADPRLHAVGDHQHGVGYEQRRNLRLIGLELLKGRPHGRVLVGRVLELDHGQRQAVEEQHHVRTPRVLSLRNRELVDGEPVIVGGHVEVDDLCLRPGDRAVLAPVLDRDAIDQHPVHRAVALHERPVCRTGRRRIHARELAVGVFQRLGGKVRIQADERLTQPPLQHDVAIVRVAALGSRFAGGDVGAVEHRVAQRFEPGEGGGFDDGFGEGGRHGASHSARIGRAKKPSPNRRLIAPS
jgi:hypothetical protein